MADPFSFNNVDPNAPGMLGQPVGFWQDLARFGGNLASAANARTAGGFLANGPDIAGPLGAAVTGTLDQARQNAVTQSALAGQSAETQGKQIQNQLAGYGLPAAAAQARLRTRALTEPGFLQNLTTQLGNDTPPPNAAGAAVPQSNTNQGGIPVEQRGPLVTGAVQGTPVPPAVLHGLIDYETGGSWNPASVNRSSHAFGLQQSLPSTAANPGFNLPEISPTASPAEQAGWAAKYLAARGTQAGVKDWNDSNQVSQALAAYHGPQKDANGIDGPMYAQQVLRRAMMFSGAPSGPRAQIPESYQTTSDNETPSNPTISAAPSDANPNGHAQIPPPTQVGSAAGFPDPSGKIIPKSYQVAQTGGQIPVPAQTQPSAQPYGTTPDQAAGMGRQYLQQANELDRRANAMQIGSGITGLPMGDPTALRTQAQQTRAMGQQLIGAAPLEAAKAGSSNIDARPGATIRFMGPNGPQWYKSPIVEQSVDASGATHPVHVTPPLPGEPEGTPGTATPILGPQGQTITTHLPPNLQDARNKAYTDFAGKDTDSYIAAQNTHAWLEQMNHAADTMNAQGGFLGSGPTAPHRLAFASTLNDIVRTAGLPEVFDPNKITEWEELKKATTTAGFELSSHYEGHARQAAQTIINATSAVPSAENSPVGFKLVSSGIQEAAQTAIDLHNYKQEIYDQNGDLNKAEVEFYKQNPAQMYARRAISTVTPYGVSTDQQLNRYLPGTFVKYKGNVVQVPERPGAPPIPEYLKSVASPTGQSVDGG